METASECDLLENISTASNQQMGSRPVVSGCVAAFVMRVHTNTFGVSGEKQPFLLIKFFPMIYVMRSPFFLPGDIDDDAPRSRLCCARTTRREGGVRGHTGRFACLAKGEYSDACARIPPPMCIRYLRYTLYRATLLARKTVLIPMLFCRGVAVSFQFAAVAYRSIRLPMKRGNRAATVINVLRPFQIVHAYR